MMIVGLMNPDMPLVGSLLANLASIWVISRT